MTPDGFEQWRIALAGGKPGIHEGEPFCGYFRVTDRSKDADLPKGTKRPWVPAAIYMDWRGNMVGERDGKPVHPTQLWPYAAMHPITYDEYLKMHEEKQ